MWCMYCGIIVFGVISHANIYIVNAMAVQLYGDF